DLCVAKYEGETPPEVYWQADHYILKAPYCLWVPVTVPEPDGRSGHDVWFREPEDGPSELRCRYYLNDQSYVDADEVGLVAIDPDLQERAVVSGPTQQGVMHEGTDDDNDQQPDGIKVYGLTDDDLGGEWRVVFIAQDGDGATDRRTHDNPRMLAANAVTSPTVFEVWFDHGGDSFGIPGSNDVQVDWPAIKYVFELVVGATYREHHEVLKRPIITTLIGGAELTDPQKKTAVRFHVTTVFQNDERMSMEWPAFTFIARNRHAGTKDVPDQVRFSWQSFKDQTSKPDDDPNTLKRGVTNAIIHELAHAAGSAHHPHDDAVGDCVMDDHVRAQLYTLLPSTYRIFGAAEWLEHAWPVHVRKMRGHLKIKSR
ncbi:MAG: hypothetical protein GW911_02780, partial [Armatimonadetes bacterium]|nr:hypothetical protein [Armatimonadota bacterium]